MNNGDNIFNINSTNTHNNINDINSNGTNNNIYDINSNGTNNNINDNNEQNDDPNKFDKVFLKTRLSCGRQCIVEHALMDTGCRRNLISLNTLLRLGKNAPRIIPDPVRMTGAVAGADELRVLGYVYLNIQFTGTKEHLVRFHVIENLASTAIIGRETIVNLKFQIYLDKQHIIVDNVLVPLLMTPKHTPVRVKVTTTVNPGEDVMVPCYKTGKSTVKGTYICTPTDDYKDNDANKIVGINTIFDLRKTNNMGVVICNKSDRPITLQRSSIVATAQPTLGNVTLHVLGDEDLNSMINDIPQETDRCFAVKSGRRKRPTHSRPYLEDDDRSDEEIIRSELKYNKDLLSEDEQERLVQLCLKHKAAFSLRGEVGCSKAFEYKIRMKDDAEHFFTQAYKVSDFEREILTQELSKLLKLGIIERANDGGYVPMCSPALLVAKTDNSARLVSDFRKLNSSMIPHHESFSTISELLNRIGHSEAKFYSSFDIQDSFWNVRLHPDSRDYTTFTPFSKTMYRYARMPQGIKNAPAALQSMTNAIYGDLEFLLMYADDLLLLSSSKGDFFDRLETFLIRTENSGIKLSLKKSNIFDSQCTFLGYHIEGTSIRPLEKHVQAIRDLPTPTTKQELKRLLGSVNWTKGFIKSCSAKTHRLYKLLRKGVDFEWTSEHASDLEEIKKSFITPPVLQLPRGGRDDKYILYCDASSAGLGGTLMERDKDGKVNICGYCSRCLTPAEANKLSISEQELLAIVFSVKFFHSLLYNPRPFEIWTDHKSLKPIISGTKKHTTKRISSMVSQLSEYSFDLHYVRGENNQMSDMLSRDLLISNRACAFPEIAAPVEDRRQNCPSRQSRRQQNLAPEFGQYVKPTRGTQHTNSAPVLRRSARVASKRDVSQDQLPTSKMPKNTISKPTTNKGKKVTSSSRQDGELRSDSIHVSDVSTGTGAGTKHPEILIDELSKLPDFSQIYGRLPEKYLKDERSLYNVGPSLDGLVTTRSPAITTEYRVVDQQLIDDPRAKVTFSPRFAGSVPRNTRNKIIEMARTDYSINISKEEVQNQQRLDPYYRPLITYLHDRILPVNKAAAKRVLNQEEKFCLISGLLFRLPRLDHSENLNKFKLQLVIPETLCERIIWRIHCDFYGVGHAGFIKCLVAIKQKYYIHDLANRLRRVIKSCGMCLKVRGCKKSDGSVPLQIAAAKSCDGPFQSLQMDHATDIPSLKYKARHILVISDEWSSFLWCFPCQTTSAIEAAKYVNLLFRRHGICDHMASDRGPAFISGVMQALTDVYKFKYSAHVSYNAQSTGFAESAVKRVKLQIKYAVLLNPSVDIFDIIQDIEYSLNNGAIVHATGVTPHYAFHGFEVKHPGEVDLTGVIPKGVKIFTEELQEEVNLRRHLITNARRIASLQMKYDHDSHIQRVREFCVGDMVLLRSHRHPDDHPKLRKFALKEKGPFIVHQICGMNCLLRGIDKDTGVQHVIPDLFSIRHLKKIDSYKDSFPVDSCRTVNEQSNPEVTIKFKRMNRFKGNDQDRLVLLRPEAKRHSLWYPLRLIDQEQNTGICFSEGETFYDALS